MKRMRKNNTIILFVILLLSISIGYALINTNLKINGTANVTKQTWDIHFENIQVTEGSVTTQNPATINPEYPTTVTYNIHLENPGDFYEFEVDAVNNGSIDAMITNITSTDNGQSISLPSYMEYKVTYSSGTNLDINHILEANTTETYKVGIYFKQDIQASDLANSDPLDLRLKFEVTYGQATDEATPTGDITVTFDPNGGTVSKTSKKVATNGKYGNLPTPTRPGYRFKGWRGYNLLNLYDRIEGPIQGFANTTQRMLRPNEYYIGITSNNYYQSKPVQYYENTGDSWIIRSRSGYGIGIPINVTPNTTYTLRRIYDGRNTIGAACYDISGNHLSDFLLQYRFTSLVTLTTVNDCTTLNFVLTPTDDTELTTYSDIQLTPGENTLEYEPYYITKDTKVVRTEDFTLTAEWEPITYNVTLDYNDGVTPSTTMQVTYGSTYENLPSPTRTGYTFKGWNGKNKTNFDLNNITLINVPTSGNRYAHDLGKLSQGTYTISYDLVDENDVPTYLYFFKITSNNEATRLSYLTTTGVIKKSYTFDADGDSNYYMILANGNDSTLALAQQKFSMLKDIQLELGSRVTAYEPYYITNSTPVVQNTDHTLTAIWEENT